ncbi:unnamed protein product [Lactuca saligna]|uniref:Uncharacterized protein n=1 Tax=Lactuca saligna TaxID=75948 RepID=A0AA36E9Q4_LACSI|nr:unnamed protein product [Lactuca saligna]
MLQYATMRVWETWASEDEEDGHGGERRNRQKLVNRELLRSGFHLKKIEWLKWENSYPLVHSMGPHTIPIMHLNYHHAVPFNILRTHNLRLLIKEELHDPIESRYWNTLKFD